MVAGGRYISKLLMLLDLLESRRGLEGMFRAFVACRLACSGGLDLAFESRFGKEGRSTSCHSLFRMFREYQDALKLESLVSCLSLYTPPRPK